MFQRNSVFYGQRQRGSGLVKGDCIIRGIAYLIGETVGIASSSCLQCHCAKQSLLCIPLCCYEPIDSYTNIQNSMEKLFSVSIRARDPHPLEHLD